MKLSKFKFKDTKKDNRALIVMGVFLFIFIVIIGTAFMVGDNVAKYQKRAIDEYTYWQDVYPQKMNYRFAHDALFVFSEIADVVYRENGNWDVNNLKGINNQDKELLKEKSDYFKNEYFTRLFDAGYTIVKWTDKFPNPSTSEASIHILTAIEHLYDRGTALANFLDKMIASEIIIDELSEDEDFVSSYQELDKATAEINQAVDVMLAMNFRESPNFEWMDDKVNLIDKMRVLFENKEGNYSDDFITNKMLLLKDSWDSGLRAMKNKNKK